MKLLVDENLPHSIVAWFRANGHDAVHARDIGLASQPDRWVWSEARSSGALLLTQDRDLAERRAREAGPSIVWVRWGNLKRAKVIAQLEEAWPAVERELAAGRAVVELSVTQ